MQMPVALEFCTIFIYLFIPFFFFSSAEGNQFLARVSSNLVLGQLYIFWRKMNEIFMKEYDYFYI